jgi:hypothetical protein
VDDVSQPERAPALRFGPDRRTTALAAVGVLIGVGLAITTDDPQGRFLFGLAAAVLACYALGDVVFSPRLYADGSGLRIRTPMTRVDLAWADVDDVRADVRSRYGVRSSALEVDAGETLVVFSRRSLGADPDTVADLVRALDPRRR